MAPWSWTSTLQKCEEIQVCCLSYPVSIFQYGSLNRPRQTPLQPGERRQLHIRQLEYRWQTLTDALPKKIHRWQISIWKDIHTIYIRKKCKLKQGDITINNSQNPEHWQHQTLDKMWNNRNSYSLLEEMHKWYSHFGTQFGDFLKIKHTFIIRSRNHALVLPKGVQHLYLHKNLNTDIRSSFIYNCHNLETMEMSFRR